MTPVENNTIVAEASITINKSRDVVFGYIANLRNDKLWRSEITQTDTNNTEPGLQTTATEHSFLSKKVPDHIYQLQCTTIQPGAEIVYQTIPGSPFFLQSLRRTQAITPNSTLFTYRIQFHRSVVKHAMGIQLPKWLITWKTKSDMKKYLQKLSEVI